MFIAAIDVQILSGVKEGEQVITVGGLGWKTRRKSILQNPPEVKTTKEAIHRKAEAEKK